MQLITKAQADFIKTFGGDKAKAIYFISRWGWNNKLSDGSGIEYENEDKKPFLYGEKMKMIEAIINGYEIKKEEKWVLATDVYVKGERVIIYYQGTLFIPSDSINKATRFNTRTEALDHKALTGLNQDYHAEPVND